MKIYDTMSIRKRIIINADDCGMSRTVNEHIEKVIQANKITSTTLMANMEDFDGAVALSKKYGDRISFGWHINLTEGKPLLYSQLLLDKGFFIETEHGVEMNGRKFLHKWLPLDARNEIKKELMEQYTKLRDSGIDISHIDSHHHVHTSVWGVRVFPSLLRETGISAMRCMFNNKPQSIDTIMRKGWAALMKMQVQGLRMPDVQSDFERFSEKGIIAKGNVIELECHPGHPKFMEEEKLLMQYSFADQYELITYRQL